MPPLLIDIGRVPADACNDCIEDLFKAISQPSKTDDKIWEPHQNPWLTRHVEAVSGRLLAILEHIRQAIEDAMAGRGLPEELHKALDAPWVRWDPVRLAEARAQLEATPPGLWGYEQYSLLIDFLLQRYLGDGVIRQEAEYLAVRAGILGKMQVRAAGRELSLGWEDKLPELVATTFRAVPPKVLSPIEVSMLEMANARAAQAISDVTESARARMKRLVLEYVQGRALGQPEATDDRLATALFDEFSDLNRDCRRIAVTEVGEAATQGFVLAHPPGTRLQRMEAYKGACDWCRSINGRVVTVVDPAKPDKNGDTEVWPGKTNAKRSASPRKRAGGTLVEREPHERWWIAAGLQHPHCRGAWTVAPDSPPPPDVDPEFEAWLNAAIAKVRV